ncbi:protein cueball isoform X2 [Orussus abietinus]|nr:protein cueball isoform X2 [Orussus abietinus]
MYLADAGNQNVTIYTVNLSEGNSTVDVLLEKRDGTHIWGMVFDTISRTLFWTDVGRSVIAKMHLPVEGRPGEPSILHNLTGADPRGIALDLCNRHIYWTNSNSTNPSIERSNLDGSSRELVVQTNLYEPLAVAVDHGTGKLYWIDDEEGIHFKVERSNLDGLDRELLVHGKHQQPVYMAVDQGSVFWTDWVYGAAWSIGKTVQPGDVPTRFLKYFETSREYEPTGLVARDNVGDSVDCRHLVELSRMVIPSPDSQAQPDRDLYNNLTTSTEETDSSPKSKGEEYCLNGARYSEVEDTCRCEKGFEGPRCERSVCQNYCLAGRCSLTTAGKPRCECNQGHSGGRCDVDLCRGYCLNGGRCSFRKGQPFCECAYSRGQRCEDASDQDEVCALFCWSGRPAVRSIDTSLCRCDSLNETRTVGVLQDADGLDKELLAPILGTIIGALVITVGVLSYHVNKLRRRPRVKKRFLVSRNGLTPLTSRPRVPGDQCEITIENCCNMNICETPCFEPKLRTSLSKSGRTKEEKDSLIDSMDGGCS